MSNTKNWLMLDSFNVILVINAKKKKKLKQGNQEEKRKHECIDH